MTTSTIGAILTVGMASVALALLLACRTSAALDLKFCPKANKKEAMVVVKLGGAAITHKSEQRSLNKEALMRCVEAIGAASRTGVRIAIVHGAGSFGHAEAREYGISKGRQEDSRQMLGVAYTRQAVTELARHVADDLVAAGVPACVLTTFAALDQDHVRGGRMTAAGERRLADAVSAVLDAGLCPVVHGDVVLDESMGFAILSGDDVVLALCRRAEVNRAVFVTDVDGVYDRPPSEPTAARIPVIRASRDSFDLQLDAKTTDVTCTDVTGGMRAKLTAALEAARAGVPVAILKAGNLGSAIRADDELFERLSTSVNCTMVLT